MDDRYERKPRGCGDREVVQMCGGVQDGDGRRTGAIEKRTQDRNCGTSVDGSESGQDQAKTRVGVGVFLRKLQELADFGF